MRIGIWGVKWTFAAVAVAVAASFALAACGMEPELPSAEINPIATVAPPPTATPMPPSQNGCAVR